MTTDGGADPDFRPREAALARGVCSALAFPAVGSDGPAAVVSLYGFERGAPSGTMVRTLRAWR